MTVTPDVIGVIVAVFVAAVGFLSVVARMLRRQDARSDERFARERANTDQRFEQMQAYMDRRFDRVDAQFAETNTRISRVESEVVEMKIAIARLEGPPRHLAMR